MNMTGQGNTTLGKTVKGIDSGLDTAGDVAAGWGDSVSDIPSEVGAIAEGIGDSAVAIGENLYDNVSEHGFGEGLSKSVDDFGSHVAGAVASEYMDAAANPGRYAAEFLTANDLIESLDQSNCLSDRERAHMYFNGLRHTGVKWASALLGGGAIGKLGKAGKRSGGSNPLDGTTRTSKVQEQMRLHPVDALPDNHGFPGVVDNFAGEGRTTRIVGGDGVDRDLIQVDGSYNGADGTFEWIVEPDNTVNHRFFDKD